MVYAPALAANAIRDAGVTGAFRQAPIVDDPRRPASRQMSKLTFRELAGMTHEQMVAAFRRALRDPRANGRVGVDEITPGHWTPPARDLQQAMAALGGDARCSTRPRDGGAGWPAGPAPAPARAQRPPSERDQPRGATLPDTYRGNLSPPSGAADDRVAHPLGHARRPSGEASRLRVLIGPSGDGLTQAQVR